VIGTKPVVKIQSVSAAPGIDTTPPSVGQVPTVDDVSTDSATVSVDVSMLPAEDSGYVDDDDEDDEINQHIQGVLGYSPSESLRIQHGKSAKFGYLSMMTVPTLGALNAESFCERVLSCVKLVVSDLHVSLIVEEIHMLVMFRMNHEFMEYMRTSSRTRHRGVSEKL
jgi:hypothetical protein